ncbi:hypothetical protein THTE_4214 [Thermogutta terrifontis]|uniref:Uncharacterized protein n=1 Tax=Thermogutta terrifontis TaxID=1331910 RepID=A0A286RLF6_9BACT|nr:hypothetical protein THTE_4214 [Thermogutta terrifontis]
MRRMIAGRFGGTQEILSRSAKPLNVLRGTGRCNGQRQSF